MKNVILSSSIILASLSIGEMAFACDRHGAGYGGFGMGNAQWQSYSPKVSITDPAFYEDELTSAVTNKSVPPVKAKPSFSNAANMASAKAKARVVKKADNGKVNKQDIAKKPT
ncbi:MAG: hypothetical protein ABJG88_08585 [Litorimonas sp.]